MLDGCRLFTLESLDSTQKNTRTGKMEVQKNLITMSGFLDHFSVNYEGQIKVINDGEIVYADWLQGYGQLVIVDHGQGMMSLYGHNKTIHRTVGDHVKQSDIIASMGNTAGLRKSALYFEIRKDGIAQDPLKWCRSS